jgi:acetyl/propionyl-CoA carboxylase alpha subunit
MCDLLTKLLHRAASIVLFENVKYYAAAEITNADAIHPGYGFFLKIQIFKNMSEHGIKFIGLLRK